MEEIEPVVEEKHKFEGRVEAKLITLFGHFGLSECRFAVGKNCFFNQNVPKSDNYTIQNILQKKPPVVFEKIEFESGD